MKIKTIDVYAKEWFDKINGNSYFAGNIIINFDTKSEEKINMPFQYGYGEHYRTVAFEELKKRNFIKTRERDIVLWRYCSKSNITLRANIERNCLKRELKQFSD